MKTGNPTHLPMESAAISLIRYEPQPGLAYSIEVAERLTHMPRRNIAVYCRHGLVAPIMDPDTGGWSFNDEGIRRLQQIARLREVCASDVSALRLILDLMDEVEQLREEVQWLRRQSERSF